MVSVDEEDRDWISFLNHLVAAGREHTRVRTHHGRDAEDIAAGGPTRDAATDVFLRELPRSPSTARS